MRFARADADLVMTDRLRSPVLGYNHNLRHRGRVFHVQTEDSGPGYARLYTHLFFEGTILASKKQEYDPISSEDQVRALMQGLHKEMIRELTHGGHDEHIAMFFTARGEPAVVADAAPAHAPAAAPVVEAAIAEAQPEEITNHGTAPIAITAGPMVVAREITTRVGGGPHATPKPVVVVKPGALKRPPVVLSTSADGVVVRRNVVINVGGGAPPVDGTADANGSATGFAAAAGHTGATPSPVAQGNGNGSGNGNGRARSGVPIALRGDSLVTGAGGRAAAAGAEAPPQPLASSRDIRMPWETPAPSRIAPPVVAAVADGPPSASREIRMPWDAAAPASSSSTGDAFAADADKGLDEVILEYLSDDAEAE